jgi:NAD(P)-dependent dehydrogenase (short-subunit alcohol dehydrogenase family)
MPSTEMGDYARLLDGLNAPKAKVYPVLEGKVAIVTGAAQGMGKATALLFAEAGASVVLADVNESGIQELAREIEKMGWRAHAVKTDISSSSDVQNLVNEAVAKFGRLDCAVNNAGLTPDGKPLAEFDEAYFDKLMSVNVKGTALCNKYEIAQMRRQGTRGGSIVNVSSIVAYRAHADMVAYTTSKHAIVGLTKQAASENGDANIRVNTIAPGAVLTEMSAKALTTMGTDHEAYARQSMLGRWAAPHEVAQGSLWLCSDASSYVTATLLPVDAGAHTK